MDPKDKAHYYMELIKVVLQRWQGTQKNQWTFNAIFWTGILLSAPYLQNKEYDEPGLEFGLFSICVTGGYAVIVYLIQKTLEWDKEKYKSYRTQLEGLLDYRDNIKSSGEYFWKWLLAQVFMTVMLLTGVYLFLSI